MLRRMIQSLRHLGEERAAADLQAWSAGLGLILAMCSAALRQEGIQADIGVPLDRIDRELMRFRGHAAGLRRLDKFSTSLGKRARQLTDDAFQLRNLTRSYLLRWQTFEHSDPSTHYHLEMQRKMEEAWLTASRALRQLTADFTSLLPELRSLVSTFTDSRPSGSGPTRGRIR